MRERQPFLSSCVNWPRKDVPALIEMVENRRPITSATFARNTDSDDRETLYRGLGFDRNTTIRHNEDCGYIGFYSGRLNGRPAYWIEHSRIEYVFAEGIGNVLRG